MRALHVFYLCCYSLSLSQWLASSPFQVHPAPKEFWSDCLFSGEKGKNLILPLELCVWASSVSLDLLQHGFCISDGCRVRALLLLDQEEWKLQEYSPEELQTPWQESGKVTLWTRMCSSDLNIGLMWFSTSGINVRGGVQAMGTLKSLTFEEFQTLFFLCLGRGQCVRACVRACFVYLSSTLTDWYTGMQLPSQCCFWFFRLFIDCYIFF